MRLKSFKLAAAVAAGAVAGAALLFSAAPASAANPPYDGCPGWALCLYQNGGGTGSKAIITPPAAGGHSAKVTLYSTHFLNGELANNQVSSWLNNSNCSVQFMDDPDSPYPMNLDYAPAYNWGRTGDWSFGTPNAASNDRLSGFWFYCP
jgi:hypothetical protein